MKNIEKMERFNSEELVGPFSYISNSPGDGYVIVDWNGVASVWIRGLPMAEFLVRLLNAEATRLAA